MIVPSGQKLWWNNLEYYELVEVNWTVAGERRLSWGWYLTNTVELVVVIEAWDLGGKKSVKLTICIGSILVLVFGKVAGLLNSISSSRLLQLEARSTGWNLILWKSNKQINHGAVELRQWNLATQSEANTFMVFFQEFKFRPKLFYLIIYQYLLQC